MPGSRPPEQIPRTRRWRSKRPRRARLRRCRVSCLSYQAQGLSWLSKWVSFRTPPRLDTSTRATPEARGTPCVVLRTLNPFLMVTRGEASEPRAKRGGNASIAAGSRSFSSAISRREPLTAHCLAGPGAPPSFAFRWRRHRLLKHSLLALAYRLPARNLERRTPAPLWFSSP
jgi:hypothetical protein